MCRQVILDRLLKEPVLRLDGSNRGDRAVRTSFAYQLRFAVIKNLATIFANASYADQCRALELYSEALAMDREDIVTWNRMGSLVSP